MFAGMAGPRTVLVVDDEPQLLRLLTRALEKRGLRVLGAADGNEALAVLEADASCIDAIVLDVVLPPSGVEPVLSRIDSLGEDVGVVLTSGGELPEGLRARLDALGGVFLRKPFSAVAAHDAVQRLIGS